MKSMLLSAFAAAIVSAAPLAPRSTAIPSALQNILDSAREDTLYDYPTALTRGISPKAIHSHNDYWRDVPFYSALATGCVSAEADVWLINNELYVGHERQALTEDRTLNNLYIQPILDTLNRENPITTFNPNKTHNGVYDGSSSQTFYLWIDLKSDGHATFPVVIEALEPLRAAGYLTTFNGTVVIPGAVTVVGTGDTPLDLVAPVMQRDYFYDAPLANLTQETYLNITPAISPIASTDFGAHFDIDEDGTLNSTALEKLRSQIKTAGDRGIGVRYWGAPAWPISSRNALWKTLVNEGVALLNADDLEAAAGVSTDSQPW